MKVGLFALCHKCWISSEIFPVCRSCNQRTSGGKVVQMFNHLQCFKILLKQLVILKKTKTFVPLLLDKRSLSVVWRSCLWLVTTQPFQSHFRCSHFYKHSCNIWLLHIYSEQMQNICPARTEKNLTYGSAPSSSRGKSIWLVIRRLWVWFPS